MKRTLKITASLIAIGSMPLLAGCENRTPVEVTVVYQKTPEDFKRGMREKFPHIVVERADTKERIMMSDYTLGRTGETFTVQQRNLHW